MGIGVVEAKLYARFQRIRGRLLTYDEAAVPEGGAAVYSQLIGLTSSFAKDPAGHIFHFRALQQAGLVGQLQPFELVQPL